MLVLRYEHKSIKLGTIPAIKYEVNTRKNEYEGIVCNTFMCGAMIYQFVNSTLHEAVSA
ncbi:hypothetical protein HYC85_005175 [Camellia sinensis]|uniref:Uncharacterized protein n=1 Tax=Camellia sinensis TaxID=4442 RepID=A0A7J7HYQ4_CAMSI|nr:hypothetical protein HYC85_005175 [Camellia sinensis]